MRELLPLFPLDRVLFPGEALPLYAFEERHRRMVRDVLDGPGPGCIGVIAIREGRESGTGGVRALHEIGCTATLRQAKEQDDGRFVLVTVGTKRFRLAGLDHSRPYPRGEVDLLGEDTGDQTAARLTALAVHRAFRAYVEALAGPGAGPVQIPDLSGDPVGLSYLVAETMILDLPVK